MTVETGLNATFAYPKLPAKDLARAQRFYHDHLGLDPFAERQGHLYYDVAGVRFMIFQSSGEPAGTHDQLGFVVADLARQVHSLRDTGVRFEDNALTTDGVADFGPVRAAWFKDSEGNLVNLIEGTSPLWADKIQP